ncbi:growth/differentiation factor 6-A [Pempheris klunzingeri]|uniref:growth/differentiation factor 6-A n=1 Tax=Pempheris klunzingeri TaxID=3127111 RepID=UPI00397F16CF
MDLWTSTVVSAVAFLTCLSTTWPPVGGAVYPHIYTQMDRAVLSLLWIALCVEMESTGPPRDSGVGRRERPLNRTVVLHDYMMFLYRSLSDLHRGDAHFPRGGGSANTATSFVDEGADLPSWESGQYYIFDLSNLPRMDELVKAELRILRKPALDLLSVLTNGGNCYTIRLYSCAPEPASDRQLLASQTVDILDGNLPKWEVFDVWPSIGAHQQNPKQLTQVCFHLLVLSELTNEVADPSLLGLGRLTRPPQERALLVAFSHGDTSDNLFREIMKMNNEGGVFRFPKRFPKDEKIRRRRYHQRALSKRSPGGRGGGGAVAGSSGGKAGRRRTRCGRKPLHVNFKDLGWDDWIIAPLDYVAYHCDGLCDFPLRSHLEPTNHAVIQTLMNSIHPGLSPPSCCVPSKLSPISILYIDAGNNVVYKQYEDMVVESCGCR